MNGRAVLVAGLLAVPCFSGAQARTAAPMRVTWPLIDFLVLGDSTHGLQLLASPTLSSVQGRLANQALTITLPPVSTRVWAAGVAALVESIAKLPPRDRTWFASLALKGNLGRAWLRVSLNAERTPETPFDMELFDSSRGPGAPEATPWAVAASATDLFGLLTTLDAVAERSAVDTTAATGDSMGIYLTEQLDNPPQATEDPHVKYPDAARTHGREGRVWLEYVVDTSGAILDGTVRVLMSDGDDFSQAILEAVPRIRYAPGRRRGAAVRTLVWTPVTFRLDPGVVRKRLPFVIRIP
ncbi:MAG TPA: energy transducer TonB [Gemmatimonadales bacterium]|nr:energy transducer TonB [Gemmatimonadales bacterium]